MAMIAGCSGTGGDAARPPLADLARLPMRFEPAVGGGLRARGAGYELALTSRGSRLTLAGLDRPLKTTFTGTLGPVLPRGAERLPGRTNYLIGSDPSRWRTGVAGYGRAVYREVWPGIDVAYRGDGRSVEYDYRLDAGADPSRIAVRYDGAETLRVDRRGDLVVGLPGDAVLRERAPRAFQDGRSVASRFVVDGRSVGVALGAYDRTRPLLIDPELSFGTYLGGAGVDGAGEAAVDSEGNIYVVGLANDGFPTTAGTYQGDEGGGDGDAFVTKLSPDGKDLVYSTFIGGGALDNGTGIAIGTDKDDEGKDVPVAYVAGVTKSSNFPTTPGSAEPDDPSAGADFDSWIAKLSPDGSELQWSTYLGGDGDDTIGQLVLNDSGEAWVTGTTKSSSVTFPTTGGAADTSRDGTSDGFLVRMAANGAAYASSGFIGGSGADSVSSLALDSAQNPVVAGRTDSTDLPGTAGAAQPSLAGPYGEEPFDFFVDDAFVTRFGANGATVAQSTYLGGGDYDYGYGVAVDGDNNVYLTGSTVGNRFPATAGAFQTEDQGPGDGGEAFVAKFTPTLNATTYATYLGGSSLDSAGAIVVDDDGAAHVGGLTFSPTFPVTDDALQETKGAGDGTYFGPQDGFYSVLNAGGDDLDYSTFLGGTGYDGGVNGLAIGPDGTLVIVGETYASDFPGIANGYQDDPGGSDDAFVLVQAGRRSTAVSVACAPSPIRLGQTTSCTATVSDTGDPPATVPTGTVRWESDRLGSFDGDCTLSGPSCSVTFTPQASGPPDFVVTGRYGGDATHASSSGTASVTVTTPPGGGGEIPLPGEPTPSGGGGGPGGGGGGGEDEPGVEDISFSDPSFRAADSGPSATASRAPIGTTVSYTLTDPGTVRFTVQKPAKGRKVGKKCKRPSRKTRKKKKCTRYKNLKGSFALTGKAGVNRFRFTGRLRGKKLKPGRYRLRASAGGQAATAAFRIVR